MKALRLIIPLALALFAPLWMGQWQAVLTGSPPASGPTYLLEEQFETGSAPSGWTTANAWTWNVTSPVLLGTYCAKSQDWGIPTMYKGYTATGEIWGYVMVRRANITTGGGEIAVKDGSGNNLLRVILDETSTVTILFPNFSGGATTGTMSADTNYHLYYYYKKGSGANASAWAAFSTDGSIPTSGANYVSSTAGDSTADAARCYIAGNGSNLANYWDRILISASAISANP